MPTQLTLDAIQYASRQKLVIRNDRSNRQQVRHHTSNYAVPIHTFVEPALFFAADKAREAQNYCSDGWYILNPLEKINRLREQQKQTHLQQCTRAIHQFIQPHTSFGLNFTGTLNYTLRVAANTHYGMDSFGKYATGGRTSLEFNEANTEACISFSDVEKTFIGAILLKKYDAKFNDDFNLASLPEMVADSIRYVTCNRLCTLIMTEKLVRYLNTRDPAAIPLPAAELLTLLDQAIADTNTENLECAKDQKVYCIRKENPPQNYLTTQTIKQKIQLVLLVSLGMGAISVALAYLIEKAFPNTLPRHTYPMAFASGFAASLLYLGNQHLSQPREARELAID